ncbi:MAG TPA: phosphatase PAP2 family protein, partial [Thermoanaerobaculia bacterium]
VFLARAMDLSWERGFLTRFARSVPVPHSWAIWLESPGNGIVLWPVVLTAGGIAAWRRRPLAALTMLVGFVLLDAAVLLGWNVWERPRPAGGHSFSAFPSGHVSQTLVAYGLLIELWLQQTRIRGERLLGWTLLALLTLMVAVGRTALGAHWPSDIAAGSILGLFWLMILIRSLRRGERARMQRKHG